MGYEFKPDELKRKYSRKVKSRDKEERSEALREIDRKIESLLRNINLDPSDNKLIELAFFTALKAFAINESNSSLRKVYNEINNIKDKTDKIVMEGGDINEILAMINKARVIIAYLSSKKRYRGPSPYQVFDEALRITNKVIEKSSKEHTEIVKVVNSLHLLAQAVIAFHKFLGGKD